DPDNDSAVASRIANEYGFQPLTTSILSGDRFYFYLTLGNGEQLARIPLDDMSDGSFERNLKAAIQRFSQGFTKTVAFVAPSGGHPMAPMSMSFGASYEQLRSFLGRELNVISEDLSDGLISGNV